MVAVGDDGGVVTAGGGYVGGPLLVDEGGVFLVAGEDDGLAQAVGAGDADAVGDDGGQDFVDGVAVVQLDVDAGGGDFLGWCVAVVAAPFRVVPGGLLFGGQFVVTHSPGEDARLRLEDTEGDEVAVVDRLLQ